jgi:hypothetical protein
MEEVRQCLFLVQGNTAKVLGINGKRYVVWDNSASSADAHNCDDYVFRKDGVAL